MSVAVASPVGPLAAVAAPITESPAVSSMLSTGTEPLAAVHEAAADPAPMLRTAMTTASPEPIGPGSTLAPPDSPIERPATSPLPKIDHASNELRQRIRSASTNLPPTRTASAMSIGSARRERTVSSHRGSPFRARSSKLDLERLERDKEDFRGFFVLFWIGMGYYVALTVVNNWSSQGTVLGMQTFKLMFAHVFRMLRDDLAMVVSMSGAFIINLLFRYHILRHRAIRLVLHHAFQAVFLLGWLSWIWARDLAWMQTAFLTLHTMAMLLKNHSYLQVNGELNELWWEEKSLKAELANIDASTDDADAARERRNEIVEALDAIDHELQPGRVRYPNNLTPGNFVDYLVCPTLVYQLEYPRTTTIRWGYVAEKSLALAGTIMLMYITVEHYITPVLANLPNITFVQALLQLLFPFMLCYLMVFYIIFECVCNGFAELSRFADRNFYDDWWNSSSFDQFARKWNKPVHEFLLRHVYLESITSYKVSKANATYLTFFFSSCLHELAMIMVSKRVRFYLFALQMFQIPLIWFGRLEWSRRHRVVGNAFFWFGIFAGPPLLAICYCWDYVMVDPSL
ncbi:hypothetical protein GGF31_004915 [Allomyces arbusculus]|nr:hypothetical protein GGF31_004915 [Allomyces arbusculus]